MAELLPKQQGYAARVRVEQGGTFLFYLSLLAFFVTLASYGGLTLLDRAQERARAELTEEIQNKETELRSEVLDQIYVLEAQLKNLRTLLSNHQFPSKTITLLEMNAHPRVKFSNFNFVGGSRKLDMSGEAASYGVVAEQVGIFERNQDIDRVEFGGLALAPNNLVSFRLSLTFRPSLLQLTQ